MPTPNLPVDLTAHTLAKAADVMADLNELVSILDANTDGDNLKHGSAGQIWVCDGAGKPQLRTFSGDGTLDSSGVFKLGSEFQVEVPAALTLTSSYQNIPNISFSSAKAGNVLIVGVLEIQGTGVEATVQAQQTGGTAFGTNNCNAGTASPRFPMPICLLMTAVATNPIHVQAKLPNPPSDPNEIIGGVLASIRLS